MSGYKVQLHKILKEGFQGNTKTEIWATIFNKKTNETVNKLIYWEDDNGLFHDETPNLPIEMRDIVDNAWIEKKRTW
jgi:hypothetical protein